MQRALASLVGDRSSKKDEMAGAGELSKLNILVAQLESIVAAASHQQPQPLICFDLLGDLLSTISQEPKRSLLACQRRCEDALQALLILGVRPPVRRLAASAIVHLIEKGDSISIYSRTSSLQGWLSDKMDRKSDPASCIGVAQCLGALLQAFGRKVISGLLETCTIVAKLMRYSEVRVRQAALELLKDALMGSGCGGPVAAYSEALRVITKLGIYDRSAIVRAAAAGCLRVFAVIGGPGVGPGGLEVCSALCLKALEDPVQAVRDGSAAALGAVLALGLNPQISKVPIPVGKGPPPPSKPIDGGLQRHLITPFVRASGQHYKEIRVGLTMAWVAFLQGMHVTYLCCDSELQKFAIQAIGMLALSPDNHAQACVLFCLRVGIIEQMGESAQKDFTDQLIKQLSTPEIKPAMLVVILRTLSHLLATLGEISTTSRDVLDNTLVAMLSNSSRAVRAEVALALRTLAEVDAKSANNLLSCGITTIRALRETIAVARGDLLRLELDSLHGQAAMLAALITACPRLVLGVPSRLPAAVWDVARDMVLGTNGNSISFGPEKEAGWMLIASIVASMPREELEEKKFDILVLWTGEFGGLVEDRLKRAENMLMIHLSGWSAAVDALTAFVKSFVVPNMSPIDQGVLLQPITGYLSGALACLVSKTLRQPPEELRPAIDLFTIQILRAFQALSDPFTYQHDHSTLLSICTAPFRDPASYGASSCLRRLLDSRDASLGPWIPGRDSFEDELRAFEGGADGLLPCIWGYEIPAFPQPLPVATVLLDEMLLCFGTIFTAQTENGKLQLLDIVVEALRTGRRQSWHSANMTNTCVALLGALKASIGLQSLGSQVDAMKQVQAILLGILSEDGVSPAERRAAAEGVGILARLASDVFAARLTRSLLGDAAAFTSGPLRGSLALALGCVHHSVGGMALSALVPATVQTLCALAKDPSEGLHIWSLHGLWLTADAAGLSYVPHVQATLSLVMELILSEEHAAPELGQSIGRLINAVVAVLGPELSPGSSLFTRCKAVVAEISNGEEPAALLECVLFTQQLALFASRAVPVHTHVKTLRPTLTSRQPSLRQAAVSTLRHLAERDAMAMCEERIEEDLFAMLDNETDENIIQIVRSTLQRLLEEACPSLPSRWLHLCRHVILATSMTSSTGSSYDDAESFQADTANKDIGEDDQDMIVTKSAAQSGSEWQIESKKKDMIQIPRYKTRVFAAECLRRLPVVVGDDLTHFDLVHAKETWNSGDWLVLHLGELVAVAYQVAVGTMESVRPMGVELLDSILDKFGKTKDPLYEGHLLLEQYQAQLFSAVRTALDPSAEPLLLVTGSRLATKFITGGFAGGDHTLIHRIVSLLTKPLLRWEDIRNPNYAEWVGCKVQVSLLGALAALKVHAISCSRDGYSESSDGVMILPLITKHVDILGRYWIGLLRDFAVFKLHSATKVPTEYPPFLEGIQIVTTAQMVREYLSEVWPTVLEAFTVDSCPAAAASFHKQDQDKFPDTRSIKLTIEDFRVVWALSLLIFTNGHNQAANMMPSLPTCTSSLLTHEPELASQIAALGSLQCLCVDGFYSPDMLSLTFCQDLIQILSTSFIYGKSRTPSAMLSVLDAFVKSCPQVYMDSKSIFLSAAELCVGHIFHHLAREVGKSDNIIISALQILGNLVGHLDVKSQDLLLPQLLFAGLKLLNLVVVGSSLVSSIMEFITCLSAAVLKPVEGSTYNEEFKAWRASILAAAVESLARISIEYVKGAGESRMLPNHVDRFLDVMVVMVPSIPEEIYAEQGGTYRKAAEKRCISSLRSFLQLSDRQVQLAALQTLRAVSHAGSTEESVGESRIWAILLLRELGADIMQIVYDFTRIPLTTASAAAVGESLKLLIILHTLVEGDNEAQQNVLHLLLPAIISAAKNEDNKLPASVALRTAAVNIVTHLASVPSSAAQVRMVLLELPPESRQQLMYIIKASVPQQRVSTGFHSAAPLQLQLPVPVMLSTVRSGKTFLPPPSSSLQVSDATAVVSPPVLMDDLDDDWDDFQDNTDAQSVGLPVLEETDDKFQASKDSSSLPQSSPEYAMFSTSSPKGLTPCRSCEVLHDPGVSCQEDYCYQVEDVSTSDSGSTPRMLLAEEKDHEEAGDNDDVQASRTSSDLVS